MCCGFPLREEEGITNQTQKAVLVQTDRTDRKAVANQDDLIICRCEEVTLGELRRAVALGARTVASLRRSTRAGMGLCQGHTCCHLLAAFLRESTGARETGCPVRPPARPVELPTLRGTAATPEEAG